jgi:hypothetical protein
MPRIKAWTFRKSTARAMQNTNTVYLDLHHDTLEMATAKVMDPRDRCMVTPDTPDSYLVEELRSRRPRSCQSCPSVILK